MFDLSSFIPRGNGNKVSWSIDSPFMITNQVLSERGKKGSICEALIGENLIYCVVLVIFSYG